MMMGFPLRKGHCLKEIQGIVVFVAILVVIFMLNLNFWDQNFNYDAYLLYHTTAISFWLEYYLEKYLEWIHFQTTLTVKQNLSHFGNFPIFSTLFNRVSIASQRWIIELIVFVFIQKESRLVKQPGNIWFCMNHYH